MWVIIGRSDNTTIPLNSCNHLLRGPLNFNVNFGLKVVQAFISQLEAILTIGRHKFKQLGITQRCKVNGFGNVNPISVYKCL